MVNFKFVFNNKVYTFNQQALKTIFDFMMYNELIEDDGIKYVLSFKQGNFQKKTYDELDYHEFILDGAFRVSNLLCNIRNVFGDVICEQFAKHLSEDTESTNYFQAYSLSELVSIANIVFGQNSSDLEIFQQLLSLLHLFKCAGEDYEQSITDSKEFSKYVCVNGIAVRKESNNGFLYLKPIYRIYDSSIEDYITCGHVKMPQSVYLAVVSTHKQTPDNKSVVLCKPSVFYLKFKQITGSDISEAPSVKVEFKGGINTDLIGKWYRVYKSSNHPVMPPMYHIMIDWFKEDGTLSRSVVFQMSLDTANIENWKHSYARWKASQDEIQIIISYNDKESIEKYVLKNDKLFRDNYIYYRFLEDALQNIEEK